MSTFVIGAVVLALLIRLSGKHFFSFLGWLYLARVSVVGLTFLLGLPIVARGGGRALAIGAYDLYPSYGAIFVGLLLPLLAWAIFLTAVLVFIYGANRAQFDIVAAPDWLPDTLRYLVAGGVLFNVWTIFAATDADDRCQVILRVGLGLLIGCAAIWYGERRHRGRRRPRILYLIPKPGDLVLSAVALRPQARHVSTNWLRRGYRYATGPFMRGHILAFCAIVIFAVASGVISHDWFSQGEELIAMTYLLVLAITAVLALGQLSFFLDAYRLPFISALIVWLLLVGQSEQADHFYRIWPSTSSSAAKPGNAPPTPGKDAPAPEPDSGKVLSPAEVLERAGAVGRPVVLVAIAGGGIQSSAWGVRVLAGLERMSIEATQVANQENKPDNVPADFASAVQCLSGVSGGSTGAMFFAASYGPAGLPAPGRKSASTLAVDPAKLEKIVEAAEATSLGQSVWGLAYPDLRRAWVPFGIDDDYMDRAEKMEIKWAYTARRTMASDPENAATMFCDDLGVKTLTQWQEDVRRGIRPATIFNSTTVETGERLSFSTAPIRLKVQGQREFVIARPATPAAGSPAEPDPQLYPGADLLVTTAARLSATFPIISPSARPRVALGPLDKTGHRPPNKDYRKLDEEQRALEEKLAKLVPGANGLHHSVDGGYFENSGIGALMQWLDNGLTELSKRGTKNWPSRILVIQIEGFPDVPEVEGRKGTTEGKGERGTLYQIASPLAALYNVRGAGHTAAAVNAFAMLQQRWKLTDSANRGAACEIDLVQFKIPILPRKVSRRYWEPGWSEAKATIPPLSWHLRDTEKLEIENAWQSFRFEMQDLPNPKDLKQLLGGPAAQSAQAPDRELRGYRAPRDLKRPVTLNAPDTDHQILPADKVLWFLRQRDLAHPLIGSDSPPAAARPAAPNTPQP